MTKRQYKKQAKKRKQIIQDIITDVNAKYPKCVIIVYGDRMVLGSRCSEIALESAEDRSWHSMQVMVPLTLCETVDAYCLLPINDIPTCRLRETVMANMEEMYNQ